MAQVEQPNSFVQACLHYKKEEYHDALSIFESILSGNPQHLDSLCMKCMTLSKIGKFEDALACCGDALKIDSNDLVMLNNTGYLESILGNNQKAIETFDQILKRDPENISVLYNKALCYSRLEKYEESILDYNKILEIDPEHVDSLYNKGNDLHKLGRFKEAVLAYEQVLKLNPSHVAAKNNRVLSESKISEEVDPLGNYSSFEISDELFDKLHDWLDAGRPETTEFAKYAIESSLIEHLPEEKEDAFLVLSKAREMVAKNVPKIESSDPIDASALELAKAMSAHQNTQNKKTAKKNSTKKEKSIKSKKSHKSLIALLALISAVGFIGVYEVYPAIIFSFNTSQLTDVFENRPAFESKVEDISSPISDVPELQTSMYPQVESEIVRIFNEKRTDIGRGMFTSHPELDALALKHSKDMASRNRVDQALSTDGLPITREYADKLPVCVDNALKYSDSNEPTSALNIYRGNIPLDDLTAETIVSEWIQKDVREILLRSIIYTNVGTGVSVSSDGTLYVSQLYC